MVLQYRLRKALGLGLRFLSDALLHGLDFTPEETQAPVYSSHPRAVDTLSELSAALPERTRGHQAITEDGYLVCSRVLEVMLQKPEAPFTIRELIDGILKTGEKRQRGTITDNCEKMTVQGILTRGVLTLNGRPTVTFQLVDQLKAENFRCKAVSSYSFGEKTPETTTHTPIAESDL